MRKPDPKIYEHTLNKMGLEPQETIFLDDLGVNVKAARAMGIDTIKVYNILKSDFEKHEQK